MICFDAFIKIITTKNGCYEKILKEKSRKSKNSGGTPGTADSLYMTLGRKVDSYEKSPKQKVGKNRAVVSSKKGVGRGCSVFY